MEQLEELLSGIHSTTIAEVSVLVREVQVRVGVLSKPVVIRVYYVSRAEEPYRFALSARMKTAPGASAPDDCCTAPSEGEALRRAVRALTRDYEDAVRQGRIPDDAWLVDGERL